MSEIINHLLNLEEKIPFDFLIDGEFLRSSLKLWRTQQASERSVVTIEYVKALVAPQEHHDSLHLDWIKCIASHGSRSVTGSFDGSLRVFDADKQYEEVFVMQNGPGGREIWDVTWLNDSTLICGGKACVGQVYKWDGRALSAGQQFPVSSSVSAVGASNEPPRIVLGTNGGNLHFFDVDLDYEPAEGVEGAAKKQRTNEADVAPALSLAAHKQAVTSCLWRETGRLVTGSMDRSTKLWDIDSGASVFAF